MSDTISNIINRINALRSLATKNPNPNEAANAAAAAAKLIDAHNLSEADLIVRGEKKAEDLVVDFSSPFSSGRRMLWIDNLMVVLTEHFGCSYYWTKKIVSENNRGRQTVAKPVIVGRKSDVEVYHYFFGWLQPLIQSMAKQNASGAGLLYSQNYMLGMVEGIKKQFEQEHAEQKRQAQMLNRVSAMVLLDNRQALAEAHLNASLGGKKLKARPASQLYGNAAAMEKGQQDGARINLTRGLGGGTGTKLLK